MGRILGISGYLRASAIALLFASGCAQSEGERCEIDSDCADGLICRILGEETGGGKGSSQGNGTCKPGNAATTSTKDAAADQAPATVPVEPQIDAGSADAAPFAASDAAGTPDTTSIDTGAID